MPDITNQKALREFCTQSNCEVWKAIQQLEPKEAKSEDRHALRTHCVQHCQAYAFVRWIDWANKAVRDRDRKERYK
jgi:hypothetical protein